MSNRTSKPIQIPLPIEGATFEVNMNLGYCSIVDAIDADLAQLKWYANGNEPLIYASGNAKVNGKWRNILRLHRMIMERIVGRNLETAEFVDHIDLDTLNNRRSNLRLCTHAQNVMNKRRYASNKLGVKGVYKRDGKFRAQIQVSGQKIMLGTYETIEQAQEAYRNAATKYHGEFARLE